MTHGDALEYMKEVEAWGGGVSRYFTACAASGLPPPIVSEEAGFFKVVLDPSRNRAIGFVYENHEGGGGVKRHSCSVDEVERITGHDFFSVLPDNVENAIESSYNFDQWN